MSDHRPAIPALHVYAICFTRENLVQADIHFVVRSSLQHDSTGFEVREVTPFDRNIGIDGDKTRCQGVVRLVALQLAVNHFKAGPI